MVFSSLLFVYLFLPCCLLCYFLAKNIKARNLILLVFSLIFYAWTNPKYIVLLIVMVFINWICAIGIDSNGRRRVRKRWLVIDLIGCLLILGIFKYLGFASSILKSITGFPSEIINIVLPIGISFYTFQLISYTIDVYRGEIPAERNFFTVLLYAGLFHQCIAGPIVRYKDVAEEIEYRTIDTDELSKGVTRFAIGLAKKTLLANTCAKVFDLLVPLDSIEQCSALSLWLGMLFFMFQIYLDFSAYSDMAIGMGLMTGFHFRENFNYPYTGTSITDFWRRWHISLSTFFRDYVYIPMGGNRCSRIKQIFNLFVVWFLTGMWHGASWNYIMWGLFFFVFLVIEKLFLLDILESIPKAVGHVYMFIIVYFGWIIFKFEDLGVMGKVFKGMFCGNGNPLTSYETGTVFLNYIFFLVICIIAVTPFMKELGRLLNEIGTRYKGVLLFKSTVDIIVPILMLVLSTMALVGNSYNPFLYFQF